MPAVEIVVCPLVPGSDICGPNNFAGAAMREGVDGMRKQDGYQRFTAGMQLENPEVLEALITWESIEKHHNFRKRPDYGPVMKSFSSIRAGGDRPYHVHFSPYPEFRMAIAAPVTEVARFIFDQTPPDNVLDCFAKFGEVLKEHHVPGVIGSAAGLTDAEIEFEGVRGIAAVFMIGWQSVDAHMAFQETQLFKDHVSLLPVAEAKKIEMHHTCFQAFK